MKNLGISVGHLFRSGKFKEHLKYGLFNLNNIMENASNGKWKLLSILHKTASVFWNGSILLRKRQQFYEEEFKLRPFLKHKGSL